MRARPLLQVLVAVFFGDMFLIGLPGLVVFAAGNQKVCSVLK